MAEEGKRPVGMDMSLDDIIRANRNRPGSRSSQGIRRDYGSSSKSVRRPRTRSPAEDRRVRDIQMTTGRRTVPQRPRYPPTPRGARGDDSATIVVSNLHYEVTRDDLKELFSTVGPVSNVLIQYDRAGRSDGIAKVTFPVRRDALLAVEKFHNMPLDGLPMLIEYRSAPLTRSQNYRGRGEDHEDEGRMLDEDLDRWTLRK